MASPITSAAWATEVRAPHGPVYRGVPRRGLGLAWQLAAKELLTHGFLVGGVCGGIVGAGAAWFALRRARTKALARERAD